MVTEIEPDGEGTAAEKKKRTEEKE